MIQKKEYCGFLYEYDDEIENYRIFPNYNVNVPESFFKYYALTDFNVDALTNLYVYASHPNLFNDPFDCNEKLIKFGTWNDVQQLWGHLTDDFKMKYPDLQSACDESNHAYWNVLYKKLGIVSLATRHDRYIMWALYAQNNGICLEFDVNKFPFKHFGPFPINYTKDIPGPVHIGDVGGQIAMLIQTNVKNDWWKYEDEWRLYVPNPAGFDLECFGNEYEKKKYNFGDEHNRKFRYPLDALLSVTLGPKFFEKMVPNSISPDEIDFVCYPEIDKNEYIVLDFLARITEKVILNIKWACLSDFSHYDFVPIRITKYSENKFRITCLF